MWSVLSNWGGCSRCFEPRSINVNVKHQSQVFCSNGISTCKYNGFTFLPRFLFEQFRRYSNMFFLIVALLQQLPGVSPTGKYTTVIPLAFILTISAIKEIFEDVKRRRMDYKVNNYEIDVFRSGVWAKTLWKDVRVGEIVQVIDGQLFPADLVLLASSEPYGTAYIETSSLDGEANLKMKQAHPSTIHLTTDDLLMSYFARIDCEPPNRHLNEFCGKLMLPNGDVHSLNLTQILLRGAKLKNTKWILGTVIYSGHDSKLLMNSKTVPLKKSTIDRVMNRRIVMFFVALIVLSLTGSLGLTLYNYNFLKNAFYIPERESVAYLYNFLTFFILYSNLIPISLQVTMEMVRFFQAMFINNDVEIYDETTDTPANARTSNLNEELGQIKFLMSDKTGTLTKNVMKFRRCSIAGVIYGNDESEEFSDTSLTEKLRSNRETSQQIQDLLLAMATCHSVVPEYGKHGKINYQASSPDENALVDGAASQGVVFCGRTPETLSIYVNESLVDFGLLNVIEFTSDRKRMSVILKFPDGSIRLFCKGADSVIMERLSADSNSAAIQTYQEHLQKFSEAGYRTLCFAARNIPEALYNQWNRLHHEAAISLEDRQQHLDTVGEEIERDLTLIGVTAVEDKLQDFVPETIQALVAADIRVWILTGDKRETAINIAQSSGLCNKSTHMFILGNISMSSKLREFSETARELEIKGTDFALVVDGDALRSVVHGRSIRETVTESYLDELVSLMLKCRAVICCRMAPMQKAEIVELVQGFGAGDHIVLTIGDGANDVPMIQAANVGVGITGREGMQAASASDYSIGQFHFLRRLLFVHGSWNLERSVKVILYSLYKNICFGIIEFWFAFFSAFSNQTIFDRWTIVMFNVICTAWPPVIIGLFDRPIRARMLIDKPSLYQLVQKRAFSNVRFASWIGLAVWHSLMLFFLSYVVIGTNIISKTGRDGGWLVLGNALYTYTVVTVALKALFTGDTWSLLLLVATVGSVIGWFVSMVVYSWIWPYVPVGADMAGTAMILINSPTFWLGLFVIPIAALLADAVLRILRTTFRPTPRESDQYTDSSHVRFLVS